MISGTYTRIKIWLTRLGILPLSLWVILLIVNLTVVILPLGSIFFFRIYENQLISETEVELISQSVFIAEIYKREIRKGLPEDTGDYGVPVDEPPPDREKSYYTPLKTELDLATGTILPSRPDGFVPEVPADQRAVGIGAELADLLVEAQRTTLAGIRVLDYNGVVVAGREELGLSFAHVAEVKTALAGKYISVIRQRISDEPPPSIASISRGTGIRIFSVYPIISKDRLWGVVYLSRTPKSILKHMYAEQSKVILAGLSILTLTLFIVLVTSWTIARPIYRLIDHIRNISAGDREILMDLEVPGTKEMALLTRSFSETTRTLHARSNYIKNFATHVSHELKTPLTSIRGAAELLGDHFEEMSIEERQRFLANIREDSDRLKHLVSRLLELAQADSVLSGAGKCNLTATLEDLQGKSSTVDFKIMFSPGTPLVVNMSREVADMILCNMVDNARKHGASEMSFEVSEKGDVARLVICDNGSGISRANSAKIFDPFFTTRRESGGTGIGLAIVRSLLENHQGSISLLDRPKGACFALEFPCETEQVAGENL